MDFKVKGMHTLSAAALLAAVAAAPVHATSVSYFLDKTNVSVLPDGVNYLQVTISDGVSGLIDFQVDVLTDAFTPGSNFGMDMFFFNYDEAKLGSLDATNITNVNPDTWSITPQNNNAGGGFGFFQFELKGSGSSRVNQLLFSIVNVTGDVPMDYAIGGADFLNNGSTEFFAAHVADFVTSDSTTSAKFAGSTAVPVPAAVWLFGSGLLGLVGVARRKKQ